jgi:hypothetical protein
VPVQVASEIWYPLDSPERLRRFAGIDPSCGD